MSLARASLALSKDRLHSSSPPNHYDPKAAEEMRGCIAKSLNPMYPFVFWAAYREPLGVGGGGEDSLGSRETCYPQLPSSSSPTAADVSQVGEKQGGARKNHFSCIHSIFQPGHIKRKTKLRCLSHHQGE